VFAPIDGANCPGAATGDASAHSLLLDNGLIRVFLPVPDGAEFAITAVSDPYGCALTTDPTSGLPVVSVYRRPLPSTNLNFLSAVMFDGRESPSSPNAVTGQGPLNDPQTFMAFLRADLSHQAIDATLGHAQAASAPKADQVAAIVSLELGFYTAQTQGNSAGPLNAQGAKGGPLNLRGQSYSPGINDSLTPSVFTPQAFTIFAPWEALNSSPVDRFTALREMVAAGEKLFNTAPLTITNVRGLNDNTALGKPAQLAGTCTTCHDTPNVGNHSLPLPLDIGTSHVPTSAYEVDPNIASALAELSVPDLPVFLVSGCPDPFGQPVSFYTSDPGKALISGKCNDFNRGKGPILRGLAARAPYFHNGAAASLDEIVNFYNLRFQMGLTDDQKRALAAFLNSL
jgi:cytochrome c peroxidase